MHYHSDWIVDLSTAIRLWSRVIQYQNLKLLGTEWARLILAKSQITADARRDLSKLKSKIYFIKNQDVPLIYFHLFFF